MDDAKICHALMCLGYAKKESVFQAYMQLRLEHTFDVHIKKIEYIYI